MIPFPPAVPGRQAIGSAGVSPYAMPMSRAQQWIDQFRQNRQQGGMWRNRDERGGAWQGQRDGGSQWGQPAAVQPAVSQPAPMSIAEGEPVQGYAEGGLVRESVLAKSAPVAPTAITPTEPPKSPDKIQDRAGSELYGGMLSKGIELGLQGIAEDGQQAPQAAPAAVGPPQRNNPKKFDRAFSGEEVALIMKTIDPKGTLRDDQKQMAMLTAGVKYFTSQGDPENAREFAASAISMAQTMAATYGHAAAAAAKAGKFEEATKLLAKGYNDYMLDGRTAEVKDGIVLFRDAVTGKPKGQITLTPEGVVAAAAGMADPQAYFMHLTNVAAGRLDGKGEDTPGKGDSAAAQTAATKGANDMKARKAVSKQLDEPVKDVNGTPGDDILTAILKTKIVDPSTVTEPGKGTVFADDAQFKKYTKSIRTDARDVAAEMVVASQGSVSPEAAADLVGKMLRVDDEDPTRIPFKARVLKKKKQIDLLIDGEMVSLPMSALPRIKKIIATQQKWAAEVAGNLRGAKAAAADQAKADARSAGADSDVSSGFGGLVTKHVTNAAEAFGRFPERLPHMREQLPGIVGRFGEKVSGAVGAIPTLDEAARMTGRLLRPDQQIRR